MLEDLRYAVRTLLKSPVFTAIAVATLAIGIGANTAIFSAVNAVLLRPLPYKEPDRLVALTEKWSGGDETPISLPNYLDWRDQNQVFEEIAAYRWQAYNLTGIGDPEQVDGWMVSASFFPVLGVSPALGRTFSQEEDRPGGNRVVVISHGLWQRRYGSDPRLIGREIILNGESHTIIGVAPQGFRFGDKIELWTPLGLRADDMMYRNFRIVFGVARLKSGVSTEQARMNLDAIASRLEQEHPQANAGAGVGLTPLHEDVVKDSRTALLVLLGAVGFVLLIACANVANLLLGRAAARQKEIAIRAALGASRLRLIRQLLTESALLAVIGGIAGFLLAWWGIGSLVALMPADTPRLEEIGVDAPALSFTLAVSLLTGIVFGLAPALFASKTDLTQALKAGGKTSTAGAGSPRARRALVVAEIAIALVLLVGAGLMIQSLLRLQRADLNFDARNLLMMNLSLPIAKYPEHNQRAAFYQQLLARAESLPGVQGVGAANPPPLRSGGWPTDFIAEGPLPAAGEMPSANFAIVSPGYLRMMNIPLLAGRDFTERDAKDAPPVVIVDERLARRVWPGEDPVGKRIKGESLGGLAPQSPWVTVVGVARHVRNHGKQQDTKVEMYTPYLQGAMLKFTLMARTASDPLSYAAAVRRAVLEIDKDQPVFNIRTMGQEVSEAVAPQRFTMLLLSLFAGVALLLATVGIYGVMAYFVTQRRHEIGVRLALGAQSADVLRLVVGQGLWLALIGIGIGLVGAFVLTRALSSLLYEVSATDPITFIALPILPAAAALLACYLPARRAAAVDPVIALRDE